MLRSGPPSFALVPLPSVHIFLCGGIDTTTTILYCFLLLHFSCSSSSLFTSSSTGPSLSCCMYPVCMRTFLTSSPAAHIFIHVLSLLLHYADTPAGLLPRQVHIHTREYTQETTSKKKAKSTQYPSSFFSSTPATIVSEFRYP